MADPIQGASSLTQAFQQQISQQFGGKFGFSQEALKAAQGGEVQEMRFLDAMNKTAPTGKTGQVTGTESLGGAHRGNADGIGKVFGDIISKVDKSEKTAKSELDNFITGKSNNLHRVMTAKAEAKLYLQFAVEMRNALTDGFKELNRSVT